MHDDFRVHLVNHLTGSGYLNDAERHLFQSKNAKHVRPAFMFACGELLDIPKAQLMDFACAIELVHTATILHDDIIDEASTRRLVPSVNVKYGNKMAVLAGDTLLSRALSLLAKNQRPGDTVYRASNTVVAMAGAVALELELGVDATKNQLLEVIDGKTGALFALCGYLVGIAADNDTVAQDFSLLGGYIGRIFQLRDDFDDIDEDRQNRVMTIPNMLGGRVAEGIILDAEREIRAISVRYGNSGLQQAFLEVVQRITRSNGA